MRRSLVWIAAHGGLLAFGAGALAGPTVIRTTATVPAPAPQATISPAEQEVQKLLNKLTELGNHISLNPQGPQAYRYQIAQADVMLQLAVRSKGKERDDWLRMAIDSYYSASVSAPGNDLLASQRLAQLPVQLQQAFPGNRMYTYAALQEIRAEHMRAMEKTPEQMDKIHEHLRDRLLRFAVDYREAPDAPKAILEAAQICENMNKPEDAKRCYHQAVVQFPGTPVARKASGAMWRLGLAGEQIDFKLPVLFRASDQGGQTFDLHEMRGSVAVIYFWSSNTPSVADDFQTLKILTDKYQYRGLQVVYVNLDNDPVEAQTFLSGRLTAGVHVHQKGGLDSAIAERFGLQSLPQVMVMGRDGTVLKNAITTGQIENVISGQVSSRR
jgi:Thioredoxin-like